MIRRLLVANRGEIASRIMRTCASMGIATVGVFSDADADAVHVRVADEAIRLGGPIVTASYLNSRALIEAARRSGADAIHPGYGFLAENAEFAVACREAGIIFIGPEPEVIARMGSKRDAKQLMAAAGIPVVPGYLGDDQAEERFIEAAEAIGYPVMVKASAGGGGRGMRLIASREELPAALGAARREALAAFGDDMLILEKVIPHPRHIEFQIFGDTYSTIIHLGERECTIQRRHQKVIEETPSVALTAELRARMGAAAVMTGQQLNYTNAGTVEFILDAAGTFYFLEVNTRLQVEHPITELVTGLDLVHWQILVAEGYPLPLGQEEVSFTGHAIEARIYAEDPTNAFLPATGPVRYWRPPEGAGVRVDAGIQTGETISAYYDPLVAKISAWGADRAAALRRLDHALATTLFLGVRNNIGFLRRILLHPAHRTGDISTAFIAQYADYLFSWEPSERERETAAIAIAIARYRRAVPIHHHWRNNAQGPISEWFEPSLEVRLWPISAHRYEATVIDGENERPLVTVIHTQLDEASVALELDGHLVEVVAVEALPGEWWVQANGISQVLYWRSPLPEPKIARPLASRLARQSAPSNQQVEVDGAVTAPMPGVVVSVLVVEGQLVESGDPLLILSAMKMEHTVRSTQDGVVARIYYQPGEQVVAAAILFELARLSS